MMLAVITPALCILCSGCIDKEKIKEKIAEEEALLHKSREADPVPVKVLTLQREDATSTSSYVGRVEPSKSSIVLSQLPGTIEELNVTKGRRVSKGAVIAKVRSEAVKAAYDIAKSTLEQAEDGYARAEKVYGSGSVTEAKMVEIRTKLEQARAAERSARQALEDCSVKAPFSGVVGDVFCHAGENVAAAAPLVQLMDVESVEIHFSVPESEYARISLGTRTSIDVPALEKTVEGSVAVKGVSASSLSHAYDFTIKGISDTHSLMPGMVCKVHVESEDGGYLIIPASAVMTDMDGRYIWGVTPEDTVCKTYITVGGYAGDGIIVKEGLAEGDKIIVEGSRKVSTGMKVKAEEK